MKTIFFSLLTAAVLTISLESAVLSQKKAESKYKNNQSARSADRRNDRMCCVENADSLPVTGNSVYQLGSTWENQDGNSINIADLEGKVEIVAMFYSHCTYACPLTINDMKRIESSLRDDLKGKAGFVLVSFDPKRDSPQALKTLAKNQRLGRDWELLSGKEDDIRSLAEVLGVEFKMKSNGDFFHSSQITVLNKQGEIVFKHFGLNRSIDDIVDAVRSCSEQN
ncbi:MAG TPA: SCO family protein [Candidatus Acidoferrales bacterium]|nr:SCO family protein [Candidatus Acidoferrales bacterium]